MNTVNIGVNMTHFAATLPLCGLQ